jgi:hypothetical protein
MRATSIRKLLIASVEECTGLEQALCPVCDYPMAPNTIIAIKTFPTGVNSLAETDFSEFTNPFLLYYQKLKLEYSFDYPIDQLSAEMKAVLTKNCAALYGMEDLVCNKLSSVGLLDFIADIFCSVGARAKCNSYLNRHFSHLLLFVDSCGTVIFEEQPYQRSYSTIFYSIPVCLHSLIICLFFFLVPPF